MKSKKLLLIAVAFITVGSAQAYKKVCKKEAFGIHKRMPFKSVKPSYYFIDTASRKKLKAAKRGTLKSVVVNRCYVRLTPKEYTFVISQLKAIGPKKTLAQALKTAQAKAKVVPKAKAVTKKIGGKVKKVAPTHNYYKTLVKVLNDFKNTRIKRVVGVLMRLRVIQAKYQNLKNKKWFSPTVKKRIEALKVKKQ